MKKDNTLFTLCSLAILLLLLSGCGGRPAGAAIFSEPTITRPLPAIDDPLRVTLEAPATLSNNKTLPLTFTLTNNSDADIYVLAWHTPFEGIFNEIFRVARDGNNLVYEGPLVMRGDPVPDDYVLLQAGTSKSVEVDLATVYDFSEAGTYTIAYIAPILHIAGSEEEMAKTQDDLKQIVIPSNVITVTVASGVSTPAETMASSSVLLTGTVMDVSLSARIITLEAPTEEFSSIALTEHSALVADDGRELTLRDLQPGVMIEVSGQPGDAHTLIATQVVILNPTPSAPPPSEGTAPPPPVSEAVPTQWETYINEDFGYQLSVPPDAEIIVSGVNRVPNDAVPDGTSPEDYIAQLQAQYSDKICVQILTSLVYINILAPTDLGRDYVPCGRTGVGAGELIEKSEQIMIGGNAYIAEGFEFVSSAPDAADRLADHNETFAVELDDGTRIEYGARPQADAVYEDYMTRGRKILLQILASYKQLPN